MKGISFLLIPKSEGVVCKRMSMSGQHCAFTTFVTFEVRSRCRSFMSPQLTRTPDRLQDVKVPAENLIGVKDDGFKLIMSNFRAERLMIVLVAQRLARIAIEDSLNYATRRKVFGKRLIDSEVIRNKVRSTQSLSTRANDSSAHIAQFAHMARVVEAHQAWIESVIYISDNLSEDEANKRLGGTTALLKAHASITLELVAKEAVQILGGIGLTKGGIGERVERIRRDVTGVKIPGVSLPFR